MIVRFIDIGRIVDHHCLNFLFVINVLACMSSGYRNRNPLKETSVCYVGRINYKTRA